MGEHADDIVERLSTPGGRAPAFCDLCELPADQCGHSAHARAAEASLKRLDGPVGPGPTIPATRASECPHCGERIQEGDLITLWNGAWGCTSHVEQPDRPPATPEGLFDGL